MSKRDVFFLVLIVSFSIFFIFKNTEVLPSNIKVKKDLLIEKDIPFFEAALQKGDKEVLDRVYRELNRFDYPVVLFNLTMDPVVWNDASLMYTDRYIVVKTVDILGNPIGYIGVGESGSVKKTSTGLNLWIYLVFLFFAVSLWRNRIASVLTLILLLLCFVFTGGILPLVLFFSLLYLIFGQNYIDKRIASLVFFGYTLIAFLNVFSNPFVFYNLIVFFKNPDFFQNIFSLIIATSFFIALNKNPFAFLVVVLSLFFGFNAFVFSLLLFLVSMISGNRIGGFLLKLLIFSILLSFWGHYYSFYRISKLIDRSDFSYSFLRKQGEKKVKEYLKLAEVKGFSGLKDFLKRSGLENEEYYVAYINVLGEVVEQYSKNLPEITEIPEGISSSIIKVGDVSRLIVSGRGRFKVGKIVIAIANDVYSNPVLKNNPEVLKYLSINKGSKGFDVKLKSIDYFYLISDLAMFFIIGVVFLLVFLSNQKKKGLFERVVFSIYFGFSVIFVILGLILFVFSNKIARRVIQNNLANNVKKIEGLLENEPFRLSEDYLRWLKDVFKVDVGIYGNGVLHYSTNKKRMSFLMPFPVFRDVKFGKGGIHFFKRVAYTRLNINDIPFAAIGVKGGGEDFNPLYEFLRIVSFIFFIVFVVSYFVSFEITRKLVSPLVELSNRAKAVGKGEFNIDVEYNNDDEIKELIESVSFMARSLKENYNRLKAIVDNVSSAILLVGRGGDMVLSNRAFNSMDEELKAMIMKVKDAKEFDYNERRFLVYKKDIGEELVMIVVEDITDVIKAGKLEVITDMARKVAHDIKNPLTPIKLNIEYLLNVLKKDNLRVEDILPGVAGNILKKVEELRRISSQFSGIFKASRDTSLERIDIKGFLEEFFRSYPGVDYEIMGDYVEIKASRLKLERIFENLVENTLAFSEKPLIKIKIEDEGDYVRVVYRDNGKGIEKELVDKIFEPYFSTREEGTGLGLFIVKEFIEEINGEIKANPSHEGGYFELRFRKSDT